MLKPQKKNIKKRAIIILILIVLCPIIWVLTTRLEGEKPIINIDLESNSIGASNKISGNIEDKKNGVRKLWISLFANGKEIVLLETTYLSNGFLGRGTVFQTPFELSIIPKKLGLEDGLANLRIAVWDYSWRNWWHGNRAYFEKEIYIDTKPPKIDVLTRTHNLNQGGSGLVIYMLSEKDAKSGVCVGENFFSGYSGYFKNPDIYMAFFALSHKQGPGTKIFINAIDKAGNESRVGFAHYIQRKPFKKDTINISDRFLDWKMQEFDVSHLASNIDSMVEKFLAVNGKLRQENSRKLTTPGQNSDKKLYWKGAFLRLPGAANRAGFADHRFYKYKGNTIDNQYHMGIDLASIAHSPVPAANNGRVATVDSIGIYGKCVVVDHGFGLFSVYSHLSQIDVAENQIISKSDIIGRTGTTGLAGGDHLHFGMFINNVFINPIEWWDATWIQNNITSKINNIKALYDN